MGFLFLLVRSGSDPFNLPAVLVVNDDRAPGYQSTGRELRAVDVSVGTDATVIANGRSENDSPGFNPHAAANHGRLAGILSRIRSAVDDAVAAECDAMSRR